MYNNTPLYQARLCICLAKIGLLASSMMYNNTPLYQARLCIYHWLATLSWQGKYTIWPDKEGYYCTSLNWLATLSWQGKYTIWPDKEGYYCHRFHVVASYYYIISRLTNHYMKICV
jgi:hypothetical protein